MLKLSISIVFGLFLLAARPTMAQESQDNQDTDTRTIQTNSLSPPTETILLYPNRGVSIAYYNAGQTVETVWLDNKSRVLLSTDGCLKGLNPQCPKNSATVLHLTRLNSPLFRNSSNSSLMTVVALDGQGNRYTYRYTVKAVGGRPAGEESAATLINYSSPLAVTKPQAGRRLTSAPPNVLGLRLRSAAARAEREGLLVNPDLKKRTNEFIQLVERGVNPTEAARQAGISREFANALYKLH
jgi:hypothetical protein